MTATTMPPRDNADAPPAADASAGEQDPLAVNAEASPSYKNPLIFSGNLLTPISEVTQIIARNDLPTQRCHAKELGQQLSTMMLKYH